jgi:V/A-type H+-transporting ATPase subunit I
VLRNPFWARPFELFAGLLGTPDVSDVDPSRVLAFIAPLMFGYMFGDVGQGAVLLAAGLLLKDRVPALALLVPGGLAAIVFGFLFGSVFGIENWLPALWLHPMEHPLTILGVSLGFGVLVVSLGMLFDTLQCHWRGEARKFWGSRLGIPLTYAGLLLSILDPRALWLLVAGAAWYIGGAARLEPAHRGEAVAEAAMDYGETLLQLVVNTISFVRVGAFALAHGGLSAAVIGIAGAADSMTGQVLLLALGNALVIALEGLVVSIQTTRLVLFEFFVRFLRASGRRFCPLPDPTGVDEQLGRNPR